MSTMLQDVRYAIRRLRARLAFALVAVLTLALGIGANSAIFSVVNAVLLRPLPYKEPGRLLKIHSFYPRSGETGNLSPADFLDFKREVVSFESMAANGRVGFTTLTGLDRAERLGNVQVTPGFFRTLGIDPLLGRHFTAEEGLPGADRTAIISHGLWQRRFASDPSVIGRQILLDAQPTTVIGVLPKSFRHIEEYPGRAAEVFTLYQFDSASAPRTGHFIRGIARLKSDASLEQARAELSTVANRLEQEYPKNLGKSATALPLTDEIVGGSRTMLLMLLGAVGLVLLIACTNLANLLAAAGTARHKEIGIRAALGAGRGRLVRQLLTESVVLGLAGGAAGLLLAVWATRFLSTLSPETLPRANEVSVDGTVLAFTMGIAVLTGVLFGLMPAAQAAGTDLNEALSEGTRGGSASTSRRGGRNALIVSEVALALVLLIGAALLIRSLYELQSTDPGFAAENVLTLQISLPASKYPEGREIPFYDELTKRIGALPGVSKVGATNILPLTQNNDSRWFQIDDRPLPPEQHRSAEGRVVTPGYFDAMGLTLERGRLFDERDAGGAPLVVVISEAMARQMWPDRDPIGRRITYNNGLPIDEWQDVGGSGSREIVGIVSDAAHLELGAEPEPFFYTPHAQIPTARDMSFVIRGSMDAAMLTGFVRRQLAEMDPDVPLFQIQTLEDVLSAATAAPRFRTLLLGAFAAVGLLLALVGVYGVIACAVSQRTHEIGLRMALGAGSSDVLRMVMSQGMAPVLIGVIVGVAAAFGMTRVLSSLLYHVLATDPTTYVIAALGLIAAALAASYVPARRAARIDPGAALRGG